MFTKRETKFALRGRGGGHDTGGGGRSKIVKKSRENEEDTDDFRPIKRRLIGGEDAEINRPTEEGAIHKTCEEEAKKFSIIG